MPDSPSLREVQQRFFALITAPEGVERGLVELGLGRDELERIIASDERRSAVERLDIYANMYFFRIRDTVAELFDHLAKAMGEAPFHDLMTDYLLAHPSRHPNLRNAGQHLPQFLDGERRRSFGGTQERPGWLADLARLEWAHLEAFDAADAPALTMDKLRALAPEQFADVPLVLLPSTILLPVHYAVDQAWQALDDGRAPSAPRERRTLLIWRDGTTVWHRALEPLEAEALALVAERPDARFGHVCDWLTTRITDETEAAQTAFQWLARWTHDPVLVDRLG